MAKNSSQSKERKERQAVLEAQKKKKEQIIMWSVIAGGIALILGVIIAIILIVQASLPTPEPDPTPDPDYSQNAVITDTADQKVYVPTDKVTNYVRLNVSYTGEYGQRYNGDIIVELNPDEAPITVANFQKLVSEKFYDDLTFHRIISGFMIQGGDPLGNGTSGADEDIKGEFSANGVDNTITHERGVISMARSGDQYNDHLYYNTASSQFFIVHQTSTHLDGKYAAFGKVIYGMDSVDGIAAVKTDANDKPLEKVTLVSASFVEYKK